MCTTMKSVRLGSSFSRNSTKDWFSDPELYWKWFLTGLNVEEYLLRVLKCLEPDAKLDKVRHDSEDLFNDYWQTPPDKAIFLICNLHLTWL